MRSSIIILLIFPFIYCCPNEPTDFLIVIKASYYLSEYQWESVKNLLARISGAVELGRTAQSSQIGIYLYDNLNEPLPVIKLGSYGRSSDLKIAVAKLKQLPCGTWCAEQTQKSDADQITSILTLQKFTRPAKIFIVSSEYIDSYTLQTIMASATGIVLQQVMIPQTPGIVTYDQPYYNYYRAYYDQYRRYASRMEQVYPYMQVEIPADQYPYIQQNQRYDQFDYDSWAGSTCYSLTSCQECMTPTTISTNVDTNAEIVETSENKPAPVLETLHSGDSKNTETIIETDLSSDLITQKTPSATPAVTVAGDYEYEITADPPGMKINKTPLLDEVDEKSVNDDDLI